MNTYKPKITVVEAVRKRPGMYFGDMDKTDVANTVVFELMANSIDLFLAGKVKNIWIDCDGDYFSVSNDGPILPFDVSSQDHVGLSVVEEFLLHHHSSPTADHHAPHIHVLNGGLGLAVLNAGSVRLNITSSDESNQWEQLFGQGKVFSKAKHQAGQFEPKTCFTVWLDQTIFPHIQTDQNGLRTAIKELIHLYPGLFIHLNREVFHSQEGLLELAKNLNAGRQVSKQYTAKGVTSGIEYHVAVLCPAEGNDAQPRVISWVNGCQSKAHGSHVDGLKAALRDQQVNFNLALINVIMHEPRYAGPTRDRLIVDKAEDVIYEVMMRSISS